LAAQMRLRLVLPVALAAAALAGTAAAGLSPAHYRAIGFRVLYRYLLNRDETLVRRIWVPYRAADGRKREALLVLPAWYGRNDHPPIPLVISPHGRGGTASGNAELWGDLPAFGPFAVVNPQGQGHRLMSYSWGWRGQISDLARMPRILTRALPWLRIERARIYAIGSSMGGQETLLLDALHPRLLAGAVALDAATNMAARYAAFPARKGGHELQTQARAEIGGTPLTDPRAYAARSPITYARRLATDGVPLYIWWSTHDRVIANQYGESGLLFRTIRRINPNAPVYQVVGWWDHSAEMHPMTQLPDALVELGLMHVDSVPAARSLVVPVQVPMRTKPALLSVPAWTGVAQSLRTRHGFRPDGRLGWPDGDARGAEPAATLRR
jgi:pimeloyl-ACP methyl ester carboxylesterase